MLTSEAQIETERPSRYLVQLCRHAFGMNRMPGHRPRKHAGGDSLPLGEVQLEAEWSDTHGVISFAPWGQCTLAANANTLTLRIDASDEDRLQQIQDVITRDLDRFGRRERLLVNWNRPNAGV
jgi:hypothetical protein